MSMKLVRDAMSAAPVSLSPALPLTELLARFDRHDFNAFPVVDDAGRLLGVVSKLDVLRLFLGDRAGGGRPAHDMAREPVEAFMSGEVIAMAPDDTLEAAGQRMVEARQHSLPVVEPSDGAPKLVGMLSRGDVLRALRFRLADATVYPGDLAP